MCTVQFVEHVFTGLGFGWIVDSLCVRFGWWSGIHWGSAHTKHAGWWRTRRLPQETEYRRFNQEVR